jgi:hypothetical protein
MTYNLNEREFHMSISLNEAYFLEEMLERYLDDYVENLTKEKFKDPSTDQTKAWGYYQRQRQSGLDLKTKAKDLIARANCVSGTGTHIRNVSGAL